MIKTIRCIIQFGFNLDRIAVSLCSVDRARRTKSNTNLVQTYDSFCKISKRFRSKIHLVFLFMVFSTFISIIVVKAYRFFHWFRSSKQFIKELFDHRSFLNLNHSLIMYVESSAMSTNPPPSRSISLNSFLSWFSLYDAAAFFMNPKRPPPSPSSSPSYSASEIPNSNSPVLPAGPTQYLGRAKWRSIGLRYFDVI